MSYRNPSPYMVTNCTRETLIDILKLKPYLTEKELATRSGFHTHTLKRYLRLQERYGLGVFISQAELK